MRVKVLFFGVLRDIVGHAEDDLTLADDARLENVFEHYAGRFPRLREMAGSIVMARNHRFSEVSSPVAEGDEVAILPPVSGGASADHFFAITREPIDPRAISARLLRGEDGAVVTFEGVVRNNTRGRQTLYLDYECYEAMAIGIMERIGLDIVRSFDIDRIGIVHRAGRMEIGETSVAIVVTAAHRRPAFEAALEAIDRLKRMVPIWKKEHFAGGEVWVEGQWDRSAPVLASVNEIAGR